MGADRGLRSTPMEAQPSMEIGVLTFPGVSKQHILFHWTLQSGNQTIALIGMMGCGGM
jgi:hypothetical protein